MKKFLRQNLISLMMVTSLILTEIIFTLGSHPVIHLLTAVELYVFLMYLWVS